MFHAGTARDAEGRLVTAGGRVLSVTGTGASLADACNRAYAGVHEIHFDGMHFRTDIAARAAEEAAMSDDDLAGRRARGVAV